MSKERNMSHYYEIDLFPGETFRTKVLVKDKILSDGIEETIYEVTKVLKESGKRDPKTQTLAILKKHMVCEICNCIRRTVTDVVDIDKPTRIGMNARTQVDNVIWRDASKKCINPACIDFKSYLKKIHSPDAIGYSTCSFDGCKRTSVKGEKCEIHGGPSIDSPDHMTFETFVQENMYRTSEHEMLENLRFLDDTGSEWIVPESNSD